mmetsp:Transcript_39676/g.67998  ORF Transcript_39676/g.67998 Transcript_39676/m.67998 type:complete len:243 (+) Transcript_39676:106-834(+)
MMQQTVDVTVPAGLGPGGSFQVNANGQLFTVTVPSGVHGPELLRVQLPATYAPVGVPANVGSTPVLGHVPPVPPTNAPAVVVNGSPVNVGSTPGLGHVPPGRYWHDPMSGAYGNEGGPCLGVFPGRIEGEGPLSPSASGGGSGQLTGCYVNGRELHPVDVVSFQQLGVNCLPGRWAIDGAGNICMEGTRIPIGNVHLAAMGRKRGGNGGGDNFWSTGHSSGNSDGDAGYINCGDGTFATYGM